MSSKGDIKWPSERIPQGGMFHAPKVQYSKETNELIKLLMDEAKMSIVLRKKIGYHLRSGDSLPPPTVKKQASGENIGHRTTEIIRSAVDARRKSYSAIIASGIYDHIKYRPKPDGRLPCETAKLHLQESMSGIKSSNPQIKPLKKTKVKPTMSLEADDLINELLDQINERAEWLAEMEELGEGRKYRDEIREQIADRLRKIKQIEAKIEMKQQGYKFVE